jgi:choline dehydrogenase-like flavoprotein
MSSVIYDHIIVGGGLAGCVIASRLKEYGADLKILLIEAGPDTRGRQDISDSHAMNLGVPDVDWLYRSVPQRHLSDRTIIFNSGKGLGGSTLINAGTSATSRVIDRLTDKPYKVDGFGVLRWITTIGHPWWATRAGATRANYPG